MFCLFINKAEFNGNLSRWQVGQVTDMSMMFRGATSFNGDLSRWEVGQVTDMRAMLHSATSFDRQLGGAWATSTADKYFMFRNSSGSIAGKTNNLGGTPQ